MFLSFCRPVVNLAVTPPSRVAVVLLSPCLKSVPVSYDEYIATGKRGAFND